MRIEFPHSSREDFRWSQALLRIGSATDNDLVLAAAQAADHHLHIRQDRRGLVLEVLPGAGRVYVNARPVRERALLRLGDTLSVGDCRMLLREDEELAGREPPGVPAQARCSMALRAVAGPWSGRVLPLEDGIEFGPQGRHQLDLPGESAALKLAWQGESLLLEAAPGSGRHPLRVNGVAATGLALQPGDQIGLAMHRFVVDGPGAQPEPPPSPAEAPVPLPEDAAGPRGEVWWLIVTAAVLALGIALVLLLHF